MTPRACATLSPGAAHSTIGFGISQSGRFLRTFLDLGFNQDENGNRVFDGLDPEIASYRISLNIRFARPTRLAGTQHTEKQFPGQESPATWGDEHDRFAHVDGRLLDRCRRSHTCPKIFNTVSSTGAGEGHRSALKRGNPRGLASPCPGGSSLAHRGRAGQRSSTRGGGRMSTVRVVDGGRHPAVLDVPTGDLTVRALRAGEIKLSLVIPTFNESRNLEELVARLASVLDVCLPGRYELIVVDDDSPDQTWAVALRLADRYPAVRVMRRRHEKGLSTAVIRGWQAARGEVLAVIDADLQHPPEVVERLWAEIDRGADLAAGSRHVGGGGVGDWSRLRRALSRGAQLLGVCLLPSVVGRVSDPMSGYFLVRRSAIAGAALSPLGYKILIEVIGRGRIGRIAEVGYVFRERTAGESKVTSKVYLEYLRHLLRLRMAVLPARFFKFAAVGLSGVALDMLILWLLKGRLGWPLTLSKLVAAETAMASNFLWNDRWTFGDLAERQGYGMARLRRFGKFNAICAAGLALSVGLLDMQVGLFGINPYAANAVAIAVTTGWNFWMNKVFSWSTPQPLHAPAQRRAAGA